MRALAVGQLTRVVVAAGSGEDGLHVGGEVHGVVQLTVATPRQAVADGVAAGGLDWRSAGVAGEVIGAREPADVADVAEDLGGEYIADTAHLSAWCAAGRNSAAAGSHPDAAHLR